MAPGWLGQQGGREESLKMTVLPSEDNQVGGSAAEVGTSLTNRADPPLPRSPRHTTNLRGGLARKTFLVELTRTLTIAEPCPSGRASLQVVFTVPHVLPRILEEKKRVVARRTHWRGVGQHRVVMHMAFAIMEFIKCFYGSSARLKP